MFSVLLRSLAGQQLYTWKHQLGPSVQGDNRVLRIHSGVSNFITAQKPLPKRNARTFSLKAHRQTDGQTDGHGDCIMTNGV